DSEVVLDDAAWFTSALLEERSAGEPPAADEREDVPLSDMATRTPPAVAAPVAELQDESEPEAPEPPAPLVETPASGQQLAALLTDDPEDVPEVVATDSAKTTEAASEWLPKAKPIDSPRPAFAEARAPRVEPGPPPSPAARHEVEPAPAEAAPPEDQVPLAPSLADAESAPDGEVGSDTPAAFEQPAPAAP